MNEVVSKVKSQEPDAQGVKEWEFKMTLPETIAEAVEIFTEDGALYLLNSGLKVKKQNIARDAFVDNKSAEDAAALANAYKPGGGARKSIKDRAFDLIMDKAVEIKQTEGLEAEIRDLMKKADFKAIIQKLTGEKVETADDEE